MPEYVSGSTAAMKCMPVLEGPTWRPRPRSTWRADSGHSSTNHSAASYPVSSRAGRGLRCAIRNESPRRDWVDFEQWLLGLAVPSGQPTEQQLKTFISHVHEHMHRVDFQTTSFGLLMWRIDLTLTTDARYLAKWFGRPPVGVTLTDHCYEQFECLPPAADAEEGTQRRYRYGVVEEVGRLARFRAHLWGGAPEGFALAELVSEANDVLDILRNRFDLETTWKFTTARPDDDAAVSVPYVTSYGLNDVVRPFGARDVFERSAMIWERLSLFVYAVGGTRRVSIQERWPESVRIWLDWRLAKCLYPDLGDLNDISNLFGQKGVALFALSGPCDPSLASRSTYRSRRRYRRCDGPRCGGPPSIPRFQTMSKWQCTTCSRGPRSTADTACSPIVWPRRAQFRLTIRSRATTCSCCKDSTMSSGPLRRSRCIGSAAARCGSTVLTPRWSRTIARSCSRAPTSSTAGTWLVIPAGRMEPIVGAPSPTCIRDREVIDRELALGARPTTTVVDQLIDERLESRTAAGPSSTVQ